MTRRNLLRMAAVGPTILGADNKSGSAKPILGDGEYRYEAQHDWGELPARIKYGNTHGVCIDAQGYIYIEHTVHETSESSDTVVVFDPAGKFVRSFGSEFKGGAHGLHIRQEGTEEFLYICDIQRNIVVKTDLKGTEVLTIGYPSESPYYRPDIKFSPTNLTVAPNGDIYIGDGYGSWYIIQYDRGGNYIRTFGGNGSALGQLKQPHGIWCDTRSATPVIMVADRANHRIQNFSLQGEPLGAVPGTNLPCHFHERQGIMVVPDLGARVTLMDQHDQVITHLGDDSHSDWKRTRVLSRDHFTQGKFVCPHGACFDREGNIFVVEFVEVGRVTKLTRKSA